MFDKILQAFIDGAIATFKWIMNAFAWMLDAVIDKIVALVPSLEPGMDAAIQVAQYVNYFFPLNYGIVLFISYYTISASIMLIKWVMKFIPTIG